jgi:hypothetical protein
VALSQKHRSVLFDHLAPQVGDDVAEALMAAFPFGDGDEIVTKDFLRAELAELRADILIKQTSVLLTAMAIATGVVLASAG